MNQAYFIGAGPGDPELLTLKGARVLRGCRTVFAFPPYEETFAPHLAGKAVMAPFDFGYRELQDRIESGLKIGDVAFLVPGDLAFFSPFQGLIDALGQRAEVVPGVGTANAASAFLKKTLHLPQVCNRAVIASPRILSEQQGGPELEDLAEPGVTLLLYMNNIPLPELTARLKAAYGKNVPIAIVHRLCLPGQEVLAGTLDDIVGKSSGRDFFNQEGGRGSALTLVIVGESLNAPANSDWWDRRRRQIRKAREEE